MWVYYTVTPVDALAKNYVVVDYVPGEFSVNENDPQPTLSIVGAPQNGMNDGKTYAYYGDVIQLYAYGNQKDGVINKSSVLTWEVVSGHAVIDQTGLLTITGTGDIVRQADPRHRQNCHLHRAHHHGAQEGSAGHRSRPGSGLQTVLLGPTPAS